MVFPLIYLLNHVASMYATEAFALFAKEFMDGTGYKYKEVESMLCHRRFVVCGVRSGNECHEEEPYQFKRIISVNDEQGYIECTCVKFTKVGVLYSNYLRVLHTCCVDKVHKRWSISCLEKI